MDRLVGNNLVITECRIGYDGVEIGLCRFQIAEIGTQIEAVRG